MRRLLADLHVHTALSPCADNRMTPHTIVMAAMAAELDIIAVCDHNSAENAAAVQEAARNFADDLFCVIAGMEITTAEEAHVVALFPDAHSALEASAEVATHLPPKIGSVGIHGEQLVMDAAGNVVREEDSMLSWATDLTVSQTVALIHKHEGLAVAAHIDRPSFSVTSQLGFLPEDVVFDALEVSAAGAKDGRIPNFAGLGYPLIVASDAHFPDNIGDGKTLFHIESPLYDEVKAALKGVDNRSFCLA